MELAGAGAGGRVGGEGGAGRGGALGVPVMLVIPLSSAAVIEVFGFDETLEADRLGAGEGGLGGGQTGGAVDLLGERTAGGGGEVGIAGVAGGDAVRRLGEGRGR